MTASWPTPAKHILFSPFDLDLRAGQLRRAGTLVALRPKTFSVLVHLADHPGELVTKQTPLDAIWGDAAVTEDVVRMSIGELRAVFGDARSAPRFIETVPRRGYSFRNGGGLVDAPGRRGEGEVQKTLIVPLSSLPDADGQGAVLRARRAAMRSRARSALRSRTMWCRTC